jgi:hypothetical protein
MILVKHALKAQCRQIERRKAKHGNLFRRSLSVLKEASPLQESKKKLLREYRKHIAQRVGRITDVIPISQNTAQNTAR